MLPAAVTVVVLLVALVGLIVWVFSITQRVADLEEWRLQQELERRNRQER